MTSIHWQKTIINQLSELLYSANQDPNSMKLLLQISFFYGIFHSLGPGHGKVVVSTYLATHKTKVKAGISITIIASLVQALTAIILVSVFLFVFNSTIHKLSGTVQHFFHASAFGVILLGLYIAFQAVKGFFNKHEHHHEHEHSATCSCGHKHLAGADELNNASSIKEYIALILSIGARPCTGAILILFFSHLANTYWLGIISSILMAIGTALTTSSIALLTLYSRKIVRYYASESSIFGHQTWLAFRIFAGFILVLFGIILINQGGFGMSPVFSMR